jgi:hypothetical protein
MSRLIQVEDIGFQMHTAPRRRNRFTQRRKKLDPVTQKRNPIPIAPILERLRSAF